MATYDELAVIRDDTRYNGLLNKIRVAASIKAAAVIDSVGPGAVVLDWAKNTVANPIKSGDELINYVIASYNTSTIDQIFGASDSNIQNAVNSAVDAIYGA